MIDSIKITYTPQGNNVEQKTMFTRSIYTSATYCLLSCVTKGY